MASTQFYSSIPQTPPSLSQGIATELEPVRRALEEQLATLQLEFADVCRELYEVAQMQRKLSGPRLLRRGTFEVVAEIFPVRHLSGDFFNISDLGRTMLLSVGDIAGKGLQAAMWFTHLLGLTRMYGETASDPATALAAINRHMCGSVSAPLTSMFLAHLDCSTGDLVYCNAGHPAPILLRKNKDPQFLHHGGPVLGAVADAIFTSGRVTLEPGDTLLGYSDGLLECRNEQDVEFGIERLVAELHKAAGSSPTAMLFSVIGVAQDFAGTHAREDDCTLMVVQRSSAIPSCLQAATEAERACP